MGKRTLFVIGAALAMTSAAQAAPTVSAIFDVTSPFLVANGLQSARVIITGWEPGSTIQGFIGIAQNPWTVRTLNGTPFYNIDSVPDPNNPGEFLFEDGFYAAPTSINQFDSGLLGGGNNNPAPAIFGSPSDNDPSDNVGEFAMFSAGGSNDISIDPMAWLSLNSGGVVPPTSLNMMRLTWSINTLVHVRFVIAMNTPASDIQIDQILFPPTPGTLSALAVAVIFAPRRKRKE